MRLAAATAALVAAAALAGCGTAEQPTAAMLSRRVAVPPGGSPALARAVGLRMLARLVLPPGTRQVARRAYPPRAQELGSKNLVDVSRFFWVPMSADAAFHFFVTHVPAATKYSGTVSGSGPHAKDNFDGVFYTLKFPPPGIEGFNQLLVTLGPGPRSGTLLRADAEVIWYPPRSAAEFLRRGRFHAVTVSATFASLVSHGKSWTRSKTFTSPQVIARLARLLNGLHTTAVFPISCPALLPDFSLRFATAASQAAAFVVGPAGCSGDLVTARGKAQPILEDSESTSILAVIRSLLRVPPHVH